MNTGRAVKPELIYMDTGALVAFFDKGDKNHEAAMNYFESSVLEGAKFVVGRPVLAEFINGASKVNGKRVAIQLKNILFSSNYIIIENETEEDWKKAWEIFEKFNDQDGMDLVDCLSFAIMERLEITKAFTFDSDFATYGFAVVPKPSKQRKKQKKV
ncbi:type II toxin-antitoxin system VapC family toxin [Thermococcus argininiproducens]|nr:type II toxin-antitoxin system VapC family toxin [Thermococcus argininiproducens]